MITVAIIIRMHLALLIAFALLCVFVAECVVQVPLYVNVRHQEDWIEDVQKMDERDYDDEYYSIRDVRLGNPQRSFELSIFSGEYRSAVFDSGFTQSPCTNLAKYKLRRPKTYNPSRSTTSRYLNVEVDLNTFPLTEWKCHGPFDAASADGFKVSDDIRMGGFLSKRTNFTVIGHVDTTLDNTWTSDGWLGLMRRDNDPQLEQSDFTIYTLAKNAGGVAEVTLNFKRLANEARPSVSGTMTLGDKDTSGCETAWITLEDYDHGSRSGELINWNVGLLKFSVGSYSRALAKTQYNYTDLEFGSAAIRLPLVDFNAVVAATGAQQEKSGRYVVDCSKVPTLPPLHFEMTTPNSTLDFFVEAQDYVRNVFPRSDGKCTLQLVISDLTVEYGWWRFGTSATKNWCWHFDYETNKMSVARWTFG